MEGYRRFNEGDLELLKRLLTEQDGSSERIRAYIKEISAAGYEFSLEERAGLYHNLQKRINIFAGIASVLLAIVTPFGNISFATFAIVLFMARISDILSTVFCLRRPWMFETNPRCEAHRLSPEYIFAHLVRILLDLAPAYLISLWFPVPVKIILSTYAIGSFVATASNLYQAFSSNRTNTAVIAISNGAIGTGVYFLLKSLFN